MRKSDYQIAAAFAFGCAAAAGVSLALINLLG